MGNWIGVLVVLTLCACALGLYGIGNAIDRYTMMVQIYGREP